jgi:hypothetical protein
MVAEPLSSLKIPFDLSSLLSFTLVDSFSQELTNSSCNNFFEAHKSTDGSGRIRFRRGGDQKCWGSLPVEWREHFEAFKDEKTRAEVLKELSLADPVSKALSED